jgi:hypothetical protein
MNVNESTALDDHFKQCQQLVQNMDKQSLLLGLYTTHCATQGDQTDNMRKAILLRLDFLTGRQIKR